MVTIGRRDEEVDNQRSFFINVLGSRSRRRRTSTFDFTMVIYRNRMAFSVFYRALRCLWFWCGTTSTRYTPNSLISWKSKRHEGFPNLNYVFFLILYCHTHAVLLAISGEPGVTFLSLLFHTIACGLLFSSGSRHLTSGKGVRMRVQQIKVTSNILFLNHQFKDKFYSQAVVYLRTFEQREIQRIHQSYFSSLAHLGKFALIHQTLIFRNFRYHCSNNYSPWFSIC